MLIRIIRFVAWELRRRKLPPAVRQWRRIVDSSLSVSCPLCGAKFENLGSGRAFRWHILGHDEGD